MEVLNFYRYYYTKFDASQKQYKDELQVLMDLPKKKRTKNQKQLKNVQTIVGYMEEHEYFLEQLVKNKDLIDGEKVINIREDMDNFLIHPGNKVLREELKAEYQHMLADIVQELEEQKIEQHKLDIEKETESSSKLFQDSADQDRPLTRKEKREQRLIQEKLHDSAANTGKCHPHKYNSDLSIEEEDETDELNNSSDSK